MHFIFNEIKKEWQKKHFDKQKILVKKDSS